MSKLKKVVGKTWALGAAAAIILGSSSVIAFALNHNDAYASTVVHNATKHVQTAPNPSQSSGGYTVVDQSKKLPSHPPAMLLQKWKLQGVTSQKQMDQKYREWIANHTPGAKDMSAQQAAAYAAAIVKKVYGLNLKGYTADAMFQTYPTPNSAEWDVTFYPQNSNKHTDGYSVAVNSVTGEFINLSLTGGAGESSSTNLTYPWLIPTAKKDISALVPKNVSITTSKIVGHKTGFVYIVSNLSNGAALGVALNEKTKLAFWYHYFPKGYNGFWAGYHS